MDIAKIIAKHDVFDDLKSTNKQDAIKEMIACLMTNHPEIDQEIAVDVLSKREELSSTALGKDVAIPHGKLPTLDTLVACICRFKHGIDFCSFDGSQTFLFFVLLSPETPTGDHLKVVAWISRLFNNDLLREQLRQAPDKDCMFEILSHFR